MKLAKGFTLIELLVVITIIGILATGATAVYQGAQAKARDSIRQNDATAISGAEQLYQADNTYYAGTAALLKTFLQSAPVPPKEDSGITGAKAQYVVKVPSATNPTEVAVLACGMKNKDGTTTATTSNTDNGVLKLAGVTAAATYDCSKGPTAGVFDVAAIISADANMTVTTGVVFGY